MYGDDDNDGTFDKVVKTPGDPCSLLSCPVYGGIPRIFNMHFTLDKTVGDVSAASYQLLDPTAGHWPQNERTQS